MWCHIIHPQDKKGGSVLLLDVEDTNLGDDAVTTHLSMFTALVSSGLNVFVREVFQNNNLHFLFHMSRLSDQIFPNITIENFPKLQVVIRGALGDPDGGKTIEDYTKDCIVEPSFQESMKEERKAIAKHFPRNQITVSQIPQVERDLFKDFKKLRKSDYWQEMKRLAEKLKTFPIKKTFGGSLLDGQGLVELAIYLKETMNADSWLDFANNYVALEKNICKRSRVKIIEPLFALPTADEIEARIEDALRNFSMECELQTEISAVQKDLQHFADEKRKAEELELKAKEAVEQRIAVEKKSEEQKRKFERVMSEKNIEIERKREKEEAELKENNSKQLHLEQMKTIALLKKKLSKKSSGVFNPITSVGLGIVIGGALSDHELKKNVTTLPHSPYRAIGLRGVCWEWNEVAKQKFGLSGRDCGVIAQEVKKLYPQAVSTAIKGYFAVRYDMLNKMIYNYPDKNHHLDYNTNWTKRKNREKNIVISCLFN